MKRKHLLLMILAASMICFTLNFNQKLKAMNWNQVTNTEAKNRFNTLHRKYDRQFKRDSNWSKASSGSWDLYELNFTRWLFKNGHASEVIKTSDFNSSASSYASMIATWNTLIKTGKFSNFGYANFNKYTRGNDDVKDLKPISLDKNLQNFVNNQATFKNKYTNSTNENRVNLGIHEPSKQGDDVKRYSGFDAKFTEVLYSSSKLRENSPCIEQFIIGYIIDDDNTIPSEQGGHRWILLSNNTYAASAFTSIKGNIINFSSHKVTLSEIQQKDNLRINSELSKLGQSGSAVVFYDGKYTSTPWNWNTTHFVGFMKSDFKSLGQYLETGKIININGVKYRVSYLHKTVYSWVGSNYSLPSEVFCNVVRVR